MDIGWVYNILQPYLKFLGSRKLALWGMGNVGEAVKDVLQEKDRSLIVEFFDSKKTSYQKIDLLNRKFLNYYIVITPIAEYVEIEKQVQKWGYKEIHDYICLSKFADIRDYPWKLYGLLKKKPIPFPKHDGERLFIFGNGPSVSYLYKNNKKIIEKSKCMCVNFMANSEYYEKIRPSYYVIMDKYAFLYDKEKDERRIAITKRGWKNILEKTKWSMILFMPCYAKENEQLMKQIAKNKCIYSYFYHSDLFFDKLRRWKDERFTLYTNGYLVPFACNVIVIAIFLGIKLGYPNLYLLGADISWITSLECGEDNVVYFLDQHCYNMIGNKEYYAYGPRRNDMALVFEILSNVFKGCKEMQEYALENNISVYNLNINSYIDAFKKISNLPL